MNTMTAVFLVASFAGQGVCPGVDGDNLLLKLDIAARACVSAATVRLEPSAELPATVAEVAVDTCARDVGEAEAEASRCTKGYSALYGRQLQATLAAAAVRSVVEIRARRNLEARPLVAASPPRVVSPRH